MLGREHMAVAGCVGLPFRARRRFLALLRADGCRRRCGYGLGCFRVRWKHSAATATRSHEDKGIDRGRVDFQAVLASEQFSHLGIGHVGAQPFPDLRLKRCQFGMKRNAGALSWVVCPHIGVLRELQWSLLELSRRKKSTGKAESSMKLQRSSREMELLVSANFKRSALGRIASHQLSLYSSTGRA